MYRYDLSPNSAAHELIKKANRKLRVFCQVHNIVLIDLWRFPQYLHTRHGLHFNKAGKREVAKIIAECILKHNFSAGPFLSLPSKTILSESPKTPCSYVTLDEIGVDSIVNVDEAIFSTT